MSDPIPVSEEALLEPRSRHIATERSPFPQYFAAASIVVGITLPAFLIEPFIGHRAMALIYLLVVVVMGLFVGRGPTLVAATMSALLWNFCFVAPIGHFGVVDAEDAILSVTYFVVALVIGGLTARIRAEEKATRQAEKRATALYLLTRELAAAPSLDELLQKAVRHLQDSFKARIVVLLPDSSQRLSYHAHSASTCDIAGPEQPVADWAFEHGQPSGSLTDHAPQAETLFVPLLSGARRMGIIGLRFAQTSPPLAAFQRGLLDAFSQQIALALDRCRLREESEKAKLLAESERLSKNLLNSVSHEIRTPLAAIKGATGNLLELHEPELSKLQQEMVAEIQEATERLNRLVGNVLDITRLESGRVKPKLTLCDVKDLVHVAVKETRAELARHKVSVEVAPGLPLVPLDFVLMQQALTNLLSNGAFHTPPGTSIQVRACIRDESLLLIVADRGLGIHPDSLPRIFDKFYRAPNTPTGGIGLGLSLVKGFVEAQGGRVTAENRIDGGAAFTIALPLHQACSSPDGINM